MLIWTHTSLTNLTGKIDFGYRIFEKDEGIALIFFIPKYAIKAAGGRFYVCMYWCFASEKGNSGSNWLCGITKCTSSQ